MKKIITKCIPMCVALLLCVLIAGCSNSDSADRGFTDFEHIEDEYLETISNLDWPEGVTLPESLEGEDTGGSFQIGYGDTRASNLWEYCWTAIISIQNVPKKRWKNWKPLLICHIWEKIAAMMRPAIISVRISTKRSWAIPLDLWSV